MLHFSVSHYMAALAVTLCAATPAFSLDARIETLSRDAIENILALGEEAKTMVGPETGFPEDYVEPWHRALDRVFDADRIETQYLEALERNLSPQAIAAYTAFDASPLGQAVYEAIDAVDPAAEADENFWPDIVRYIEEAPPETLSPYVDIFEFQMGPDRGEVVMEGMYRIMAVAASAFAGPEKGAEWIATARADGYTGAYIEEFFIMSVAAFKGLTETQLQELAGIVATPDMVAYAEQSHQAFQQTYEAAIDELEEAFAAELGSR